MSAFAADVVSFDLGPPLQHGGGEAFARRWQELFESTPSPIDYEIGELSITATDEVAFSHSLNRMTGTMKNGQKTERWQRRDNESLRRPVLPWCSSFEPYGRPSPDQRAGSN